MTENNVKTSTGLEQNTAAVLAYVFLFVGGLVFFLLEKENKYVRFHAMQSIVVFGAYTVAAIILSVIPVIGWIFSVLLGALAFILWIVCIVKASQGQMFKLPIAGDIAEKNSKPVTENKPPDTTPKP